MATLKSSHFSKSLQSCPTLCDPMDYRPPGSSVHGILQARILEWAAISSSRRSSDPGIEPTSLASPVLAGDSLPLSHLGSLSSAFGRMRIQTPIAHVLARESPEHHCSSLLQLPRHNTADSNRNYFLTVLEAEGPRSRSSMVRFW